MRHENSGGGDGQRGQERDVSQAENGNRNRLHGDRPQRQGLRHKGQAQDDIDDEFVLYSVMG